MADRKRFCSATAQSILVGSLGQNAALAIAVQIIGPGVPSGCTNGPSVQHGHREKRGLVSAKQRGIEQLRPSVPNSGVADLIARGLFEKFVEEIQYAFRGELGIAGAIA